MIQKHLALQFSLPSPANVKMAWGIEKEALYIAACCVDANKELMLVRVYVWTSPAQSFFPYRNTAHNLPHLSLFLSVRPSLRLRALRFVADDAMPSLLQAHRALGTKTAA